MSERMFPISGGPAIPWRLITPHEKQAVENHDQTLERLAQRGGLSCSEAVCVLEDRPLRTLNKESDFARARLIEIIKSDQLAELSTWKARAEKFESMFVDEQTECEMQKAHKAEIQAERDTLKARCEKLEAQLAHEREYSASKGDHS